MKHLAFTYVTDVSFSGPVTNHYFVLRCLPASTATQRVAATLELDPPARFALQRDEHGNAIAVGALEGAHDHLTYKVEGTATVDLGRTAALAAHPLFRFESALAQADDALAHFLACQNIARSQRTPENAEHLMHAVHEALAYRPGATTTQTTAAQAFALGAGVCQDFAHVLISLLRQSGYPARYVSGITVGEGATHAWVQAHVDNRWLGLDPTRDQLVDETYLAIAAGRDWADCPIERGTFLGDVSQTQTVSVRVAQC